MFVPFNVAFICSDCSTIFDPMGHVDCPTCASRTHTKLNQLLPLIEDIPRKGPSEYTESDNSTAKVSLETVNRSLRITAPKVIREICHDINTL
jgi:DNA-directed RNA polymerase subunit RPC12/RpoP